MPWAEAHSAHAGAVWSELLREFMDLGRDDSDAVVEKVARGGMERPRT